MNFNLLLLSVFLCQIYQHSCQRERWKAYRFAAKGFTPITLKPKKEHYWGFITRLHAYNMWIFKDVLLKLRLAEKLQEKYKGSLAYELGIITAGILEVFRDMLETYYFYTHPDRWKREAWLDFSQMVDCYVYMHGCYMEILHQKDMYQSILDAFLSRKKAQERREREMAMKKIREQHVRTPPPPFGKRRHNDVATQPSDKEYKRMLRLRKWGEKWNYFDPVVEGIDVNVKFDKDAVKKALKMKMLKA